MKYRVVEVFDTAFDHWYRLQKSEDGVTWTHLDCGSDADKLVLTMKRLVENKPPSVVQEIEA